MDLDIINRMESKVRGYIRSFPVIFKYVRGSLLIDEKNNGYINFFSGAGTLNYGHNNPVFKEKLLEYLAADGVVHGLDMATTAQKAFLETVTCVLLKPRGWQYMLQFTGPTGTNTVEAGLKIARQVKGRSNIISFTHGFYGVSGGSLAATANAKFRDASGQHDLYALMTAISRRIPTPSLTSNACWMIAAAAWITPAAVIVETVQGEGGVNVSTCRWLKELENLCCRHDMLLSSMTYRWVAVSPAASSVSMPWASAPTSSRCRSRCRALACRCRWC